jgi:hypothetical protein
VHTHPSYIHFRWIRSIKLVRMVVVIQGRNSLRNVVHKIIIRNTQTLCDEAAGAVALKQVGPDVWIKRSVYSRLPEQLTVLPRRWLRDSWFWDLYWIVYYQLSSYVNLNNVNKNLVLFSTRFICKRGNCLYL